MSKNKKSEKQSKESKAPELAVEEIREELNFSVRTAIKAGGTNAPS